MRPGAEIPGKRGSHHRKWLRKVTGRDRVAGGVTLYTAPAEDTFWLFPFRVARGKSAAQISLLPSGAKPQKNCLYCWRARASLHSPPSPRCVGPSLSLPVLLPAWRPGRVSPAGLRVAKAGRLVPRAASSSRVGRADGLGFPRDLALGSGLEWQGGEVLLGSQRSYSPRSASQTPPSLACFIS